MTTNHRRRVAATRPPNTRPGRPRTTGRPDLAASPTELAAYTLLVRGVR